MNHRWATVAASIATLLVVIGVVAMAVPLSNGATSTSDGVATAATASPTFEVRIDETNSPVTEGETLATYATVENTGNRSATQTVRLEVGSTEHDATEVTLAGGESVVVALEWHTVKGDAGEYAATVTSEDDADSRSVRVERQASLDAPPANFSVAIDATNSPITEPDRLTVTATVENTGGQNDTQEVQLAIVDSVEDTTAVTLRGGTSTNVTLAWETELGDAGNHTATVASEDDADSRAVWISAAPAAITFDDQSVADETYQAVVVDSTYPPEGGYVVVYNTSESNATAPDSIIGVSGYLDPHEHRNVRIDLDTTLEASQPLLAEVYEETSESGTYQVFDAKEDEPYTHEGEEVRDSASIRVATATPTETATYTRTATFTPTPTPTPSPILTSTPTPSPTTEITTTADRAGGTEDDGTGFGPLLALIGLLCSCLLLRRYQ